MSDTKLLQSILNKVSSIEQQVTSLGQKVEDGFKVVNKRVDKIGLQLANLEDDAPTVEEFDVLEKRVRRLEKQAVVS